MSSSQIQTVSIGGVKVGAVGYGAMNLTWKPKVTHDEQAFAAIKTAVDGGATFINSGEFYGVPPHRENNLHLLARFFDQYPTYADKIFLSVKGGLSEQFKPDGSLEGLRASVENINKCLGGKKKMDLFEMARVDKERSVEEVMKNMLTLRDEGHFKHIGLSEVSAATIRKSAAAAPIAAVEVEYSPFSLDIETNDVLAACKELQIPIIAYSPLGRGFLTGSIKSRSDIPEGDHRLTFDRFSEENFSLNLRLVHDLEAMAQEKGVTITQLTLAWILAQWPEGMLVIPGSTRPEGVQETLLAHQSPPSGVTLSKDELDRIRRRLDSFEVKGGRYNKHAEAMLEG